MSSELIGLSILDKSKSNRYAVSVVSQNSFLKDLMAKLKESPKEVVEDFQNFLKVSLFHINSLKKAKANVELHYRH